MVLIVMLLFKNSYVFTEKKENLGTGLFYGLFYLIGSVLFILIFGVFGGGFNSGLTLLNIFLGALLVGICEEFLCRGWLLNEFLERYGDTKKGIWYSIIISGIIFGLLHIGNIFTMGQDIPTTVTQVITAATTGVVFGLIYYKTKNIWSVIILHGVWDFSLFLGDAIPITESIETIRGFSIIGILFTLLMVLAELLIIIPHMSDIDNKPKKSSVIIFSTISIFLFIVFTLINGISTMKFGDTYEYENISLEEYAVTRDNYDEYMINYTAKGTNKNYLFKLSTNDKNNLLLTNVNASTYIEIECDDLVDYIIHEDNEKYTLAYIDYENRANAFLKYVYIKKSELSNDSQYLNNIKNNMKKYLLPSVSELTVISDYTNNKSYISAYHVDYGYYLLTNENEVSVLNRD